MNPIFAIAIVIAMMTDGTLVALVIAVVGVVSTALSSLPPTLMAWATLRQSQRNQATADHNMEETKASAKENMELTQATAVQTEELVKQSGEIHQLTNSNLTAVKADLAAAKQQIEDLQGLVTKLADVKKLEEKPTPPPEP